ncbi:phosphatase PAP2 family protein [Neolewinella lacunae]|uniref:Phosphatase PAP2 family protein n=1 Tax=Neolewinella lacunae TaxID=1517758 RepID=A0A923T6D1_9BACT|nr:phosphatase PAP2 family protein [Neolewinella lacunae]MBC6993295.1 phosphatase PAP2 family protein [Neolewinella lacunae]MDN3636864.1 phosphatase PAP2 family protein [Neolewinella lacunae]
MNLDYALFDAINQGLAHPWLDAILPTYREKTTWIPLYLVMVYLLLRQYGWRSTLYLLLAVAVALAVADQLAASVLKPWVGRLRPCAEPAVADHARILIPCGGRFGFPSNHATNHFALATLLSLTWLRKAHWGWRAGLFLWAVSISLAQVYVGKHYPGDILCGAVLGSLVAWGVAWVYGRMIE